MSSYGKPLPDLSYPDHKPFWDGTRVHELRVQRCADCGTWRWFPRPMCPECHSTNSEWPSVNPRGKLFSWVVVRHPMLPEFKEDVPYTLVIVELDDPPGIRFLGTAIDSGSEQLRLGLPMEAVFDEVTEDVTLVRWRPI